MPPPTFLRQTPGPGRNAFFARLTAGGWLRIVLGVLFLFAPLWAILTARMVADARYLGFFVWCLFGGLIGVAYFLAAARARTWLLVAIPCTVAIGVGGWFAETNRWLIAPGIGPPTPTVEGVFAVLCLVVAYALFSRFIGSAGLEHVRLRTELDVAKRIHDDLVPPLARTVGRFEVYGLATPSNEVGGDIVDAIEGDGFLDVIVGDVTGHGVRSGVIMAMVKGAIHAAHAGSDTLGDLLAGSNGVVHRLTDPGLFVTMAAARLHAHGGVDAALGGHLPILHWRAATGTVETLDNEALPLGIEPAIDVPTRSIACQPGDLLAILTDGLVEVATEGGEQLGIRGFADLLAGRAALPIARAHRELMAAVEAIGPIRDDRTLVLIRVGDNR
ncbi:MAG: PP2C family protein-serine/threonine phosphatase [Planctomycetota bacterium]